MLAAPGHSLDSTGPSRYCYRRGADGSRDGLVAAAIAGDATRARWPSFARYRRTLSDDHR
jgi:hypothetical protein